MEHHPLSFEDAVAMVEQTETCGEELLVTKAVTPGFGVSFAGTDITAGETVHLEPTSSAQSKRAL